MTARQKPWREKVGPKGARVTVEERTRGGMVRVCCWTGSRYERRSLEYRVRDAGGALLRDAVKRAKRDAATLSNELLAGEREAHTPTPELTVGELVRVFRREVVARQRSPRSREESERELGFWTEYLGDDFVVPRLDSATWGRVRDERSQGLVDAHGKRTQKPQPVGPRTVTKTLKLLRQLCRFATTYRLPDGSYLLDADPTRGLDVPEPTAEPKRPMMDDERYAKLLDVAGPTLHTLLTLARETGRRISSICALRWEDWHPDAGLYGALIWHAEHDKLGRTWNVPVTQVVHDVLERRHADVTSVFVFPHPNDDATPINRQMAGNWLRDAEGKARLSHVPSGGWHMFRRLWASSRKHLSLRDVAYAGGWLDTSTLLNVYQQPDADTLQTVVDGGREKLRALS